MHLEIRLYFKIILAICSSNIILLLVLGDFGGSLAKNCNSLLPNHDDSNDDDDDDRRSVNEGLEILPRDSDHMSIPDEIDDILPDNAEETSDCRFDLLNINGQADLLKNLQHEGYKLCLGCELYDDHNQCHSVQVCEKDAVCINGSHAAISGLSSQSWYGCCKPGTKCKTRARDISIGHTDLTYNLNTCDGILCNAGHHVFRYVTEFKNIFLAPSDVRVWGPWSAWSKCDCTASMTKRIRHCLIHHCPGSDTETKFCGGSLHCQRTTQQYNAIHHTSGSSPLTASSSSSKLQLTTTAEQHSSTTIIQMSTPTTQKVLSSSTPNNSSSPSSSLPSKPLGPTFTPKQSATRETKKASTFSSTVDSISPKQHATIRPLSASVGSRLTTTPRTPVNSHETVSVNVLLLSTSISDLPTSQKNATTMPSLNSISTTAGVPSSPLALDPKGISSNPAPNLASTINTGSSPSEPKSSRPFSTTTDILLSTKNPGAVNVSSYISSFQTYNRTFETSLSTKKVTGSRFTKAPNTGIVSNITHTGFTSKPTTSRPQTTAQPKAITCAVCAGPPEACELAFYEDTCQPPNHYCINHVTNLISGERLVERKCGDITECHNGWYLGSSDDDKCRQLSTMTHLTFKFECTYCCTTDGCNVDLRPRPDTLYTNA